MRYDPAVTIVPVDVDTVRSALLDARSVPTWNESITSISDGPDVATDASYEVTIQIGLRGHFQFGLVEPEHLEFRWEVPDLRECGRWDLRALGPATRVAHLVWRHGALAISLDHARREVAPQRLARLACELDKFATRPVGVTA